MKQGERGRIRHTDRANAIKHIYSKAIIDTGPVEESVGRFWRMVWEYEIPTILMLTQCTEAGKVLLDSHTLDLHYHTSFSDQVCQVLAREAT